MSDREETTREISTSADQVGGTTVERQTVAEETTAPSNIVAQRVVWYIVGFIIALLTLRIVFELLGASTGNGFVDLVYGLSAAFAAPFFGIFPSTLQYGVSYFDTTAFVAILIYALIGWGVAKLFTLNSTHASV